MNPPSDAGDDPRIIDNSLTAQQRAVLLACAATKAYRLIHVKPLGRFGYTGAQLFQVRFDPDGRGVPFVVKVDQAGKIEKEAAALERAQAHFRDARGQRVDPNPSNGMAGLVYHLVADESDEVVELRDLYEDFAVDDDTICNLLKGVYHTCRFAHAPDPRNLRLGDEYIRYRRDNRPNRIADAFVPPRRTIDLFGKEYRHPVISQELIENQQVTVPYKFVHGDLHPNNVVFGEGRAPALIDFAWAHEADITKDFVLMECSMRFLLFAENVSWPDHHWVAMVMVKEDGPAQVRERYASDPSRPHAPRYVRMARTVEIIREQARAAAGARYDFKHYLAAQYLVLFGLSKMSVYPFFHTVDALCLIAEEVLA